MGTHKCKIPQFTSGHHKYHSLRLPPFQECQVCPHWAPLAEWALTGSGGLGLLIRGVQRHKGKDYDHGERRSCMQREYLSLFKPKIWGCDLQSEPSPSGLLLLHREPNAAETHISGEMRCGLGFATTWHNPRPAARHVFSQHAPRSIFMPIAWLPLHTRREGPVNCAGTQENT